MKELLSFTFALLFIACQNQPFSNLPSSSATAASTVQVATAAVEIFETEACTDQLPEEKFDLAKELQDTEKPGIHYREIPKTSEFDFENGYETLTCVSNVSSSEDLVEESVAATKPAQDSTAAVEESAVQPEAWAMLTEKWEYRPSATACLDPQANEAGPACQQTNLEAEPGKLFSAYSAELTAQIL